MGISRVSLHNPAKMKAEYLDKTMDTITVKMDQMVIFLTPSGFDKILETLIEFKESQK